MDVRVAAPVTQGGGEGPSLAFDGFSGPLASLLTLARAHAIDLARLPLADCIGQLVAVLDQTGPAPRLAQRADWLVMAAWLVLLRSRLLLPTASPEEAREDGVEQRLDLRHALLAARALAAWLERQPQVGIDVFAQGQPAAVGTEVGLQHQVDVVEFLWASLALFDDGVADQDTTPVYRPRWHDLHTLEAARVRILRLLTATPEGAPLAWFVPAASGHDAVAAEPALRRRSAWTSTFLASLELARQGDVALTQDGLFSPIRLWPVGTGAPGGAAQGAGGRAGSRWAPT